MKVSTKSRVKKVAGWTVSALAVVVAVAITVTVGWRPVLGARSRSLTDRRVEATSQRMERGKYLVEGVLNCFDCHSQLPSAELKAGEAPLFRNPGAGRVMIDAGGLRVAAPNITPDLDTGAGLWSDDQLARAIREG
nr:hypothetical protein [Terriglobales bacterium]